jgi:hypothetical protein
MTPTFPQTETLEGILRFIVERAEGDPIEYAGELKFTAVTTTLWNTRWFHVVG